MGKQVRKNQSRKNKRKALGFKTQNIKKHKTTQTKYQNLNKKVHDLLKGLDLDPTKMSIIDNPDQIKMSAVILKIAEPYIKMYWGNEIRVRGIIDLSMMIWNMAYLPKEKQNEIQEQWVEAMLPGDYDAHDVAAMLHLFENLQNRQKDFFPDIRKYIMAHDLKLDNENIHLNISSAPLGEGL